jgi:hypothetical protein
MMFFASSRILVTVLLPFFGQAPGGIGNALRLDEGFDGHGVLRWDGVSAQP